MGQPALNNEHQRLFYLLPSLAPQVLHSEDKAFLIGWPALTDTRRAQQMWSRKWMGAARGRGKFLFTKLNSKLQFEDCTTEALLCLTGKLSWLMTKGTVNGISFTKKELSIIT